MKNIKFILITVLASLSFFFSSEYVTGLVYASFANERPLAIIRRFKPDVNIKHADGQEWEKASMAAKLFDSDTLRTDDNGYAAVQFMDNSLVKVKPKSLLIIRGEVIDKNSTASRIAVEIGEVFLNVTKRQSQFEVQTPSAVASVKGTSLSSEVSQNGSTIVTVFSGSVELVATRSGQKVVLKRRDKGKVDSQSSTLTVSSVTSNELNKEENTYSTLDSSTKPKTIRLRFSNDAGQVREVEIQYFENEEND
jgi:hypothetical protein